MVRSFGLPVRYERLASFEELAPYMASDKKVSAAQVRWVLLKELGETILRSGVEEALVRQAIESLR